MAVVVLTFRALHAQIPKNTCSKRLQRLLRARDVWTAGDRGKIVPFAGVVICNKHCDSNHFYPLFMHLPLQLSHWRTSDQDCKVHSKQACFRKQVVDPSSSLWALWTSFSCWSPREGRATPTLVPFLVLYQVQLISRCVLNWRSKGRLHRRIHFQRGCLYCFLSITTTFSFRSPMRPCTATAWLQCKNCRGHSSLCGIHWTAEGACGCNYWWQAPADTR